VARPIWRSPAPSFLPVTPRHWADKVAVRGARIIALGEPAVRDAIGPGTHVLGAPGVSSCPDSRTHSCRRLPGHPRRSRTGEHPPRVRPHPAHTALAETLLLAGRIEFFDLRQPDDADASFVRALQAAGEADDALLGSAILAHAAFIPGLVGHRDDAADRIRAARTYARRAPASALFLAWLDAVEAECETISGHTREAMRLIGHAEATLAAGSQYAPPDWYGSPRSRATPSSEPGTSRRRRKPSPARSTTRPSQTINSARVRPSSLKHDCGRRRAGTGERLPAARTREVMLDPGASTDTPVRGQGPGRSLPGPDADHPLYRAGDHRVRTASCRACAAKPAAKRLDKG
jgi:hypothetical protein